MSSDHSASALLVDSHNKPERLKTYHITSSVSSLPSELISECFSFLTGADLCVVVRVANHQWFYLLRQVITHSQDPVSLAQHPRTLARLLVLVTALMDWLSLNNFLEQLRVHWYSRWPIQFAGATLLPSDVASELDSLVSEWKETHGLNSATASGIGRGPRQLRQAKSSRVSLSTCTQLRKESISPRTRVGLVWLFVLDLCELIFQSIEIQVHFLARNKAKLEEAARSGDDLKLSHRCLLAFWRLFQGHPWGIQRHGCSGEETRLREFLSAWWNISWIINMFVEQRTRGCIVSSEAVTKFRRMLDQREARTSEREGALRHPGHPAHTSTSLAAGAHSVTNLLNDLKDSADLSHMQVLKNIGSCFDQAQQPAPELLAPEEWSTITNRNYRACAKMCQKMQESMVGEAAVAMVLMLALAQ